MSSVEAVLRRLGHDLAGVGWALVGGFAVSARAEARFTRDVDLVVVVRDDAEAESLVGRLLQTGHRLTASIEQTATGRLATVRLIPPGVTDDGTVADLLFASSGIEHEIVAAAQPLEIVPGLTVPVASTGHLIALKLLARDDETRPMDAADLRALRAVAGDAELAVAGAAVGLITTRGYARDRDLAAALSALVGDPRP
ncbi:MAG: nucleotidyl transferase AbiEii/AbiGii toxin family protein [Pseudonocardia sp.]